jgi:hypothetical protein
VSICGLSSNTAVAAALPRSMGPGTFSDLFVLLEVCAVVLEGCGEFLLDVFEPVALDVERAARELVQEAQVARAVWELLSSLF